MDHFGEFVTYFFNEKFLSGIKSSDKDVFSHKLIQLSSQVTKGDYHSLFTEEILPTDILEY